MALQARQHFSATWAWTAAVGKERVWPQWRPKVEIRSATCRQCTARRHGAQRALKKDSLSLCALFCSVTCVRNKSYAIRMVGVWHWAAGNVCLRQLAILLPTAACVLFLDFLACVCVFEHVSVAFAPSCTWQLRFDRAVWKELFMKAFKCAFVFEKTFNKLSQELF